MNISRFTPFSSIFLQKSVLNWFRGTSIVGAEVITEQTEKGYKINFIDYGSKSEVKFDQIRLQSTGKVGQQKRTIKEARRARHQPNMKYI